MTATGNGRSGEPGEWPRSGWRLGDYELGEELGRGAVGRVYRALRLGTGEEVAVKVLDPALVADRETVGRFRHEARAAARLEHPGIVRVLDEGEAAGTFYFAMELVSGESLADLLMDRMRLPAARVAALALDAAEALAFAHRAGVTHRDIKPANLLIDAEGRCRITDFGIALAPAQTRLTRSGASLGSPHYIAPEVIQGEEPDGRADLYSLGIVLFEALTGDRPYGGRGFLEVMQQHLAPALPRVRELDRSLPEALERIVARLMAKSRDERYQSAGELADDLRRFRAGEAPPRVAAADGETPGAVSAPPSTRSPRRSTAVTVAWAVVLAGLAVAAGYYLMVKRPWKGSPPLEQPVAVSLVVAASPSPCRVRIDGRDFGYVPVELELAVGIHRFEFEWEELGVSRAIEREVTEDTRRVFAAAEP